MFSLLLAAAISVPAPSCYASQAPCTQAFTAYSADGLCVQWYEPDGDEWEADGYCLLYADIAPDETGTVSSFWLKPMTKAERDALWAKQVTRGLSAAEQAAWDGLLIHKPLSVYAVAPYRTQTTRATYPLVNGVRGSTSNGRVPIGSPCYPSIWSGGTYAALSLTHPTAVAVCVRR